MPFLHNVDINQLSLVDFPQFSCLCELCDCGCFERSKTQHSDTCKKLLDKAKKIKNPIAHANPKVAHGNTLYHDSYIKFDKSYDDAQKSFTSSSVPDFNQEQASRKTTVTLGDKNAQVSSKTTTKEHFKSWDLAHPAEPAQPYPEHAVDAIYPSDEHRFDTTNEKMFRKNYGDFKARPILRNQFEGSFRIHTKNEKMLSDSTYKQAYRSSPSFKNTTITRKLIEKKIAERVHHIPMFTETQSMVDYQYDPEKFRSVWIPKKVPGAKNLFRSRLDPHLHPNAKNDTNDRKSSLYTSHFTGRKDDADSLYNEPVGETTSNFRRLFVPDNVDKNIKYLTSFDNTLIPSLKIIDRVPSRFTKVPPIKSASSSSDFNSTYANDFKKQGMDICMAKAYKMIMSK